jgi:hypothetical protein
VTGTVGSRFTRAEIKRDCLLRIQLVLSSSMLSSVPHIVLACGEAIEVPYHHRWYQQSMQWINGTAEPDQLVRHGDSSASTCATPSERDDLGRDTESGEAILPLHIIGVLSKPRITFFRPPGEHRDRG